MSKNVVVEDLKVVLASTYALYLKTQKYHWNVTGPHFTSLHGLFEEMYTEFATAIDDIAERIRAIGHMAPGSFSEFQELSKVGDGNAAKWDAMVKELLEDNNTVIENLNACCNTSQEASDAATEDQCIERLRAHQKFGWMLRAHIE